jgi:hypothetical protein
VTIIFDFRFEIFDCRNHRQRVAMIKATTGATRNQVRGINGRGIIGKSFFPISLTNIPLTSFPALSSRFPPLTVGYCRLPSLNDGAGYDAPLRAPSAIESPAIKPVMALVKVVAPKNHSCKWLTINGVKPSQGKSNHLVRLDCATLRARLIIVQSQAGAGINPPPNQ